MWRLQHLCLLLLTLINGGDATETHLRRLEADEGDTTPPSEDEIGRLRGGFTLDAPFSWLGVFNEEAGDVNLVCGVVLVHSDIVLTTASCVSQYGVPSRVRIGSLTVNKGGTFVPVTSGLVHPEFTGAAADGADIAILKLGSALTNTVALLNEDPRVPFNGTDQLFMAGWGLVAESTPPPNLTLQGLFLNNIENCFDRAPPVYNPVYHICGDASPDNGTCAGDGGIPVLIPGTRVVVGLNSFSDRPCEFQTVDVYTRMSSYASWAKQMICEMSADPPAKCAEYNKDICLFDSVYSFVAGIFGF